MHSSAARCQQQSHTHQSLHIHSRKQQLPCTPSSSSMHRPAIRSTAVAQAAGPPQSNQHVSAPRYGARYSTQSAAGRAYRKQQICRARGLRLQYGAQHSRPKLALLSSFMAAPTDQHWVAVQGVLQYFGSSKSAGILYQGEPGSRSSFSSQVVGFGGASLGGCPDTGRSTEGYVFMLFGEAVGWKSKRQQRVTRSTAASEYLAAASLVAEG
jgi:hypothetical protein